MLRREINSPREALDIPEGVVPRQLESPEVAWLREQGVS